MLLQEMRKCNFAIWRSWPFAHRHRISGGLKWCFQQEFACFALRGVANVGAGMSRPWPPDICSTHFLHICIKVFSKRSQLSFQPKNYRDSILKLGESRIKDGVPGSVTTRISGGIYGGRTLRTPSVAGLRPTSERVRAALFSIIGPGAVEGKRVADLYAGTGALGLDALSRGAEWVSFVERNGRLCSAIREQLRLLEMDAQARVHRGAVLRVVESLPGGYDLVIADPPYDSSELADLAEALQSPRLLNAGGMLVLEHRADNKEEYAVGRFSLRTSRTYGDTGITILTAGVVNG